MAKRRRRQRALGDAANTITMPPSGGDRPPVERPLTPRELADFLKVSAATIRRRLPELPHFRIGNRVRFMRSDVLAFYRKNPGNGGKE